MRYYTEDQMTRALSYAVWWARSHSKDEFDTERFIEDFIKRTPGYLDDWTTTIDEASETPIRDLIEASRKYIFSIHFYAAHGDRIDELEKQLKSDIPSPECSHLETRMRSIEERLDWLRDRRAEEES